MNQIGRHLSAPLPGFGPGGARAPAIAGDLARAAQASFENHVVVLGLVPAGEIGGLIRRARHQRVSLLACLHADGVVPEDSLYGALAAFHDLPFLPELDADLVPTVSASEVRQCLAGNWIELATGAGRRIVVAAPSDPTVTTMRHIPGRHGRVKPFDAITTPSAIRQLVEWHFGDALVDDAVSSLATLRPHFSASHRLTDRQRIVLSASALAVSAMALVAPDSGSAVIFVALTVIFMAVAIQRLMALIAELGLERRAPDPPDPSDAKLPIYTILVPLYREANMVGHITSALLAIDYPRAKLDIKLILEADDVETVAAVADLALPGCFEVVLVPPVGPRTKPKALDYALAFAHGSFVTVYDAEDLPDRDQLRRAVAAFSRSGGRIACLQSRLSIDNAGDSWLTKQFAIEYASLFNVLLPAFDRLGMPLMLGGTSNHFRLEALRSAGGWDPYNVTEDADIGIRLARIGYRCAWLDSETREEAPASLGNWFNQRLRWMRGWLQTYLVHMRAPRRLIRELGVARFVAVQVMLGGVVAAALMHPIFVVHLLASAIAGSLFVPQWSPFDNAFLLAAALNLLVGYGVMLELGILGLYRARRADLLPQVAMMPVYWMLVSAAAYGAIWRLCTRPFRWEKTRHWGRRPAS